METLDYKIHTVDKRSTWHVKYLNMFIEYHMKNNTIYDVLKVDEAKLYSNGKGGCLKFLFKPSDKWVPIKFYQPTCSTQYDLFNEKNRDFKPTISVSKYEFKHLMVDPERTEEGGYKAYKLKDDVTDKDAVGIVLLGEYIQKLLPELIEIAFKNGKVIRTADGKKVKNKKDVLIAPFDAKVCPLIKTNHNDISLISFKFQLKENCKYPTILNVKKNKDYEVVEDFELEDLNEFVPKYSKIHFTGAINALSFSAQGISVQCLANEVWSTPPVKTSNKIMLDADTDDDVDDDIDDDDEGGEIELDE